MDEVTFTQSQEWDLSVGGEDCVSGPERQCRGPRMEEGKRLACLSCDRSGRCGEERLNRQAGSSSGGAEGRQR